MKIPRFGAFSIDWPNHIIGFFSALFGILIAFELDQWRERNQEDKIAQSAFEKLKLEVQINNNSLHEMTATNKKLIGLVIEMVLPKLNSQLQFTSSRATADSLNNHHDVMAVVFVDTTHWRSNQNQPMHIVLGNLLQPTMHNSAWESAKATGALNYMNYEQVLSLSSLYSASRITDELLQIKTLIQNSEQVSTKVQLSKLLRDLKKAHTIIDQELAQHDSFVSIIEQME